MLAAVQHGGPDDEGIYEDQFVTMGHRRLSIIDLSQNGHQPMWINDGSLIIAFNGEIYNYLELKKELEELGCCFKTKTDTEVILACYQYWGTKCFYRFEGIFAFSLYDKKNGLFFLVRDHYGVKPLYYSINQEELIFASEVRAFKSLSTTVKENEDWPILFLAFGSIPQPYTTLENVKQLAPGSYLMIQLEDWKYETSFYFRPQQHYDYKVHSKDEALAQIQYSIQKAVHKNLLSDAKIGIFLSGGIDSTLLTLIADQYLKTVHTLSVNFDESEFDEHKYQLEALSRTENVEHTAHRVSEHMFWESLPDVWKAMDQPSIDAINSYFTAKFAKSEGIKAVLSGVGADEIFGGYASFKRIKWMRWMRKLPMKKELGRFLRNIKMSWGRFVYLNLQGPIGDYLFLRGIHTPQEISRLLNIPEPKVWEVLRKVPFSAPTNLNDIEYASYLEAHIYMTNQLLKDTDYMAMWHGVEVRAPFLDIQLQKKVRSIPPSIRYKSTWPKYLLTASHDHLLPRNIIFRQKKGFTFPFEVWMLKSGARFKALLSTNPNHTQLYNQFKNGHGHWSKCWSLAVLQQFSR